MRHCILMVSDFFYPNVGGVESHIYQLSQCLINRGHKVVVFTHVYGERIGVRYMTNGLKAYYCPRSPWYQNGCLPNIYGGFKLFRQVLIREQITIVHCHQAYSALGGDAMVYARTMGMKVVFTDHSLFGFADFSSIFINKYLKFFLCDIHAMICVSHTSKENLVLRACVPPSRVSVIPNAVDVTQFEPDPAVDTAPFEPKPSLKNADTITIVCLTRLVYRKGLDLIAAILPEVCYRWPQVRVIICGDGPKRKLLEDVVAQNDLGKQVQLLPGVSHNRVRNVLIQGDIFLNASLTEAFCIAIVEAASTGLKVVSTKVGGVPEVLPPHMVVLSEPEPQSLLDAVESALGSFHVVDAWKQHQEIKAMYSWESVARRTEAIYHGVMQSKRDDSLVARFVRFYKCGRVAGKLFCMVISLHHLYLKILNYMDPAENIDIAPDIMMQDAE